MTTWNPDVTVEIQFDGVNWTDVSKWLDLGYELNPKRGRESEMGDPITPGTLTFTLVNDDGRFSPGNPSSPYYPNVVKGVAYRISIKVGGTPSPRAYGTVQKWAVTWLDSIGNSAITTVTGTDVMGAFPSYTFWQPSSQGLRSSGITPSYYWPRLDGDGETTSAFGSGTIVDNGVSATLGTMRLPLDDGDSHTLFTSASGGRKMIAGISPALNEYRVSMAVSKPSTSGTVLELAILSGNYGVAWTGSAFTYNGLTASVPSTAVWPCVVAVRSWYSGGFENTELIVTDSAGSSASSAASTSGYGLKKVTVNPTLSGGATWSAGHLIVGTQGTSWATTLLGPRIPASVSAVSQLSTWSGGPTITGATVGECVIPSLDGRDAADAIAALVSGMGARLNDNMDGTITWVPFGPSTTPIALPEGEPDPGFTWESSDIGWLSDVTVSWPDGTSYTSTRADGERRSMAIEGVHATRSRDLSYADWLVNNPMGSEPRIPELKYDVATLSEAQRVTLASVTVGSRVALTGLPTQIPATCTLIVEGIDETITASGWTITLHTSPDVYSRLFILDDPVQGVLDAGYLLAP